MHCVNSSIFFSAFLKQPWLSEEVKIRLLEWKGRADLAQYVARGCPKLRTEEISSYLPKYNARDGGDGWESIIHRLWQMNDDGHVAKLIRAVAHGEEVSKPYEGSPGFKVSGEMWQKIGNMSKIHHSRQLLTF
jgi:hypothetical protein